MNNMENNKFKLGPLQKLWIKQLRKYPERQGYFTLGKGTPRKYTACCLGELHLCYHRMKKKKLPFNNEYIVDSLNDDRVASYSSTLYHSYDKYGLKTQTGDIFPHGEKGETSLAYMNDEGYKWGDIADFIEENPESVFNKSV